MNIKRTLRLSGVAAGVAAASLGMAACGSSGTSSGPSKPNSGSSGSGSGPTATGASAPKPINLTIGIPQDSPQFSDAYYASVKGIWKRLGLNVTITTTGSTETTSLAAGRLVVGVFGTTAAFAPAAAGRQTSIVVCEDSGDGAAAIMVKKDSPYKSLQSLSGTSMGVVGANGQGYGSANAVSEYIVAHGGKPLKIVVEPDLGTLVAATTSGQVDGAMEEAGFGPAIQQGLARELIGQESPLMKSIVGTQECSTAYWGLSSTIAANKTAVTRFVAGLRIARTDIAKLSATQIAAVLQTLPAFKPSVVPKAELVSEVQQAQPFFSNADGYISQTTWNASLGAFKSWGLNVGGTVLKLNSSAFSYSKIIDMSYWEAASSLVKSAGSSK